MLKVGIGMTELLCTSNVLDMKSFDRIMLKTYVMKNNIGDTTVMKIITC